ncbi:hypothetical protein Y032_0007g3190 [Ancylostoma ceylanicum]|uniref:Secreted protein n=1 Tax=Ancylostoma ceylanicum TaxID=53326 RepID=A0A016VLS0_9BILA|nr:hypothetical protein Y032_0007g3190 [Ancylostoma ceylanicum]
MSLIQKLIKLHVLLLSATYGELQTAVDKVWDRGAAFLGRDTGALHAGCGVPTQERRSHRLSTTVWSPQCLRQNSSRGEP